MLTRRTWCKKFEPALDMISITEQRAKEIADAMNEADVLARTAIELELAEYGKALQALQDRRSKLIDIKLDSNQRRRLQFQDERNRRRHGPLHEAPRGRSGQTQGRGGGNRKTFLNSLRRLWKWELLQ